MSELYDSRKVFSLLEVTSSIQRTLSARYQSSFWVRAEMNKLNFYSHSGHCYPELVEKQEGKVIVQMKSVIWKDDFIAINSNFLRVIRESLKDGIKILFLAKISFDPMHGLSLRILDIDPSYTLGDLEKEKLETITRLKAEGIFNRNKGLRMALLPQRIAVISVETSKGYADFRNVIDQNAWNYRFFHMLFPSLLQGEKAIDSITAQLERIKLVRDHFDVVAIIRGGGGDIGLSCYNNYSLARTVSTFPLPVLTGIGHSTNETVTEMVAFENAITPTKLGEFLIQQFHNFSVPVKRAEEFIADRSLRILTDEKTKFHALSRLFITSTSHSFMARRNEVREQVNSLIQHARFRFGREIDRQQNLIQSLTRGGSSILKQAGQKIDHLEKNIQLLSPVNVLKRGYSITTHKGKALTDPGKLKSGEKIETILFEGKITSIVEKTEKSKPL